MDQSSLPTLQPDVSELILSPDARITCETYIFDPVSAEESLGRLFAVAETENRGGVGTELLDLTIQALQREYYREPSRGILASFESALHQANLVLHDTAERGVRDWMGHFHVAVGVLARDNLHVSTAGNATIFLARKSRLTSISSDLSHSPITNPLRTFAQVASGTVVARDILYFGTSALPAIFRPEELSRFSIDHSASAISTRLKQLHADSGATLPVAVLTISILPQDIVQPRREADRYTTIPAAARPARSGVAASLSPRKPLIINRTWLKTMLVFAGRMITTSWRHLRSRWWPYVVSGSQYSGRIIASASRAGTRNVQSITNKQLQKWKTGSTPSATPQVTTTTTGRSAFPLRFTPKLSLIRTLPRSPHALWTALRRRTTVLPRSSKIFAGITLLLAIALITSVVLLRQKRAEDAAIVRASELLQDARNSKSAAEDALIYDNREQARALLGQSQEKTQALEALGRYEPEVAQLKGEITVLSDRLQKIVRATTDRTRVVGDFGGLLDGQQPRLLTFVNNTLYTFNPKTNAVLSLSAEGNSALAANSSEGIGFFTAVTAHLADKVAVLATSAPGIALFDAKDNSLQNQELEFPAADAKVTSVATYGSRLYLYDSTAKNIFGYTKTLRGYSSGAPWITNTAFPKDSIISIGVDGNVYTLHSDGAVHKLLKGEPAPFTADPVDPPLAGATKLIKSEDTKNIYILDAAHKRIVIFDGAGKLLKQLFIDVAQQMSDIAISADEKTVYVLDGTRVLAITLE